MFLLFHKNDLLKAYENLLVIYEQSLEKDPINLALAITSLDCWAEQQEEGWQIDHIEKCKSKFIKSTNEIYINLKDEKLIKDLENESNKTIDSLQKKEIEKIVYFDFDDYILSIIISISMILTMIVAGLFGILVPVTLKKLNVDPAISSSVFVTTITDVIGFVSFLGVGAYFL